MTPEAAPVKARRPYRSPRRAEQARQTRVAVTLAAERLFLRDGLGPTTVAAVAAAAGVSPETVYKAFGGKPGLVRAIVERALAGEGPVSAEDRSDEVQRAETDPRVIIRTWGRLAVEVAPRASPIMLLLRGGSAVDPELEVVREELEARRMARMTKNAQTLVAGGHLRPGISLRHAAQVLWTYSSAELFELLVIRLGWSPRRHGEFIAEAMIAALLPPEATSPRSSKKR